MSTEVRHSLFGRVVGEGIAVGYTINVPLPRGIGDQGFAEICREIVGPAARLPVIGVVIGPLVTAVIQSSSATWVIAIGLVIAASVGTTLTGRRTDVFDAPIPD